MTSTYKTALQIAEDHCSDFEFARSASFRVTLWHRRRPEYLERNPSTEFGPAEVGQVQKVEGYSDLPFGFESYEAAARGIEILRQHREPGSAWCVTIRASSSQGHMVLHINNRAKRRAARLWGAAAELASTVPDYSTPHGETDRRRPSPSISEGADSGCFGCLEAGHALEGHSQCTPTAAQSEALHKREGAPSYESNGWVWRPAPRASACA